MSANVVGTLFVLIPALALVAVALVGGRLAPQRRRSMERQAAWVIVALCAPVLAVLAIRAAAANDWIGALVPALVGASVIYSFLTFIRRRRAEDAAADSTGAAR